MKLIIFHPETDELIDVLYPVTTHIAHYLFLHGYPDQCYFYVMFHEIPDESKWGRFIEAKASWQPPAWNELKPEEIPQSSRATVLLLA